MGLDMYLTRKKYIGGNYEHREVKGEINITIKGIKVPIELNKVSEIYEEVGYWRKANQIHKWFCDNGECIKEDIEYEVTVEQLKELLELCKKVKEKAILVDGKINIGSKYDKETKKWISIYEDGKIIQNSDEIEGMLPTQDGFFFGSTSYDEWYLEDIKDTIKILEEILEEEEELNKLGVYSDFKYRASW